ncbi:hypothetical protein L218DRAFT_949005 [Marasmius fiardii PR-910]|nr:hypothetical protein L218DRAFT_949005 [Marasmius fiardii PR-910]
MLYYTQGNSEGGEIFEEQWWSKGTYEQKPTKLQTDRLFKTANIKLLVILSYKPGQRNLVVRGTILRILREEMIKGKTEAEAFDARISFGSHDAILQPDFGDPKTPSWIRSTHASLMSLIYQCMMVSEGLITISCPVIDKEAVEACDEYFGSLDSFLWGTMAVIPSTARKNDAVTEGVLAF